MNKNFIIILLVIVSGLLYVLAPILTPFLVGALLAYLVDPMVKRLMRFHMPRLAAVIIVFLALFMAIILMLMLLIPVIEDQIITLVDVIPSVAIWLQDNSLPWLKNHFGIEEMIDIESLKATLSANWMKAGGAVKTILTGILHSGLAIFAWLTNLVLIPVVTFYLLRDWDKVIKGARSLLPRSIEPTVVKLFVQCDEVLSAFFRGQFLVMLSLGIIYSIGLTLIGVKVGFIIGLVAGLASIVPYLGFIVGITTASIVAFVQFKTISALLLVWSVFAIGQTLESAFLTPKLVGDRIGLHPVAVIFAVLTGATLYGFFGVLLALPVAAIVMVLLRFLHKSYRSSALYQ